MEYYAVHKKLLISLEGIPDNASIILFLHAMNHVCHSLHHPAHDEEYNPPFFKTRRLCSVAQHRGTA